MEWWPVTALGTAILIGTVALLHLARAVKSHTRAVDAMRETLERDCGAGDEF
jgi:hypothetical protein